MSAIRERWGRLRPWTKREIIPILLGSIWLTIGSSYCLDPWSDKQNEALMMPLWIMPQEGWGIVFIFCGVLAIFSARWPPHQDTWGYVVLGCCSLWWSCSYTVGVIHNDGRSFSGAAAWLVISILIHAVNDLTEKAGA